MLFSITEGIVDLIMSVFSIFILYTFISLFFRRKENWKIARSIYFIFGVWQFVSSYLYILPAEINLIITIGIILGVINITCKGNIWKKCIYSILYIVINMLIETLCSYVFLIFKIEYQIPQTLGSIFSLLLLFIVVIGLKKFFGEDEIKELPFKYNIMLFLIPIGSIFVVNEFFRISSNKEKNVEPLKLIITMGIMLGINLIIFKLYAILEEESELKRCKIVFEKQLELFEINRCEREENILRMRKIRHNIKNDLIAIMAYAENKDYDNIISHIQFLLDVELEKSESDINTGNIVVDSMVSYKKRSAENMGISFLSDIHIPMDLKVSGADLSLILGNALENAIEASQKVGKDKRYIDVKMKYDKGNLIMNISNSFDGYILFDRNKNVKTIKSDPINHGIGLDSIRRVVDRYKGQVSITHTKDTFTLKILMYDA